MDKVLEYATALETLKQDMKVRYASKTKGNFGASSSSSSSGTTSTSSSSSTTSSPSPQPAQPKAPEKLSENSVFKNNNNTANQQQTNEAPANPNAGNKNTVTGEDNQEYTYNPKYGEYVRFITINGKAIPIVYDPQSKQGVQVSIQDLGHTNFLASAGGSVFNSSVSPEPSNDNQSSGIGISIAPENNPDEPSFAVRQALDLVANQPQSNPNLPAGPLTSSTSARTTDGYLANPSVPTISGFNVYKDNLTENDRAKLQWVTNNLNLGRADLMNWLADAKDQGVDDYIIDATLATAEANLMKGMETAHVLYGGRDAVAQFGYKAASKEELQQEIRNELNSYAGMSSTELRTNRDALKTAFTDWRNNYGAGNPWEGASPTVVKKPPVEIPRRQSTATPTANQGKNNGRPKQRTQKQSTGQQQPSASAGPAQQPTESSAGPDSGLANQPSPEVKAEEPAPAPAVQPQEPAAVPETPASTNEVEQAKAELSKQVETPAKPEPKKRGRKQAKAGTNVEAKAPATKSAPVQSQEPSVPKKDVPSQNPSSREIAKKKTYTAIENSINKTLAEEGLGSLQDYGGLESFENDSLTSTTIPVTMYDAFQEWWHEQRGTRTKEEIENSDEYKGLRKNIEDARDIVVHNILNRIRESKGSSPEATSIPEQQVSAPVQESKPEKKSRKRGKKAANAEANVPVAEPAPAVQAPENQPAPTLQEPVAEQPAPKENVQAPAEPKQEEQAPEVSTPTENEVETAKAELNQQASEPVTEAATNPKEQARGITVTGFHRKPHEWDEGYEGPASQEGFDEVASVTKKFVRKEPVRAFIGKKESDELVDRLFTHSNWIETQLNIALSDREEYYRDTSDQYAEADYERAVRNVQRETADLALRTVNALRDIDNYPDAKYIRDAETIIKEELGDNATLKDAILEAPDLVDGGLKYLIA